VAGRGEGRGTLPLLTQQGLGTGLWPLLTSGTHLASPSSAAHGLRQWPPEVEMSASLFGRLLSPCVASGITVSQGVLLVAGFP
jgi:hypothetical protein